MVRFNDPIEYDSDGRILMPAISNIKMLGPLTYQGGWPTFDVGYLHKFVLVNTGPDARSKLSRRIDKLYSILRPIEGFRVIRAERFSSPDSESYYVIYAIERTGSRTQNPESPYAGYHRDIAARGGVDLPGGVIG